ncbi:MAG: sigma-54-dependent Fis family transcriptional regulator [Betaproteobacteria bacterium]|nr:sigma-54-dependent Fis family transcriptional regulator [Betaproteobacteria bacterium]
MSNSTHPLHALWLDPFRALRPQDQSALTDLGMDVHVVRTLDELGAPIRAGSVDLVVVGLGQDCELLQAVKDLIDACPADSKRPSILCRVERRNLEVTVAAMRTGALHVIATDDWAVATWEAALHPVQQADQDKSAESPAAKASPVPAVRDVIYVDPVSRNLLALAQRVALANVNVLIEGPTGAGKEVLARVLHESSVVARGPFVGLNCAALPEHMMEDLLFGHEKGAFTGAVKDHRGLFEQAQGGTLFLDEIGELPMHLQSKLLRVLQERTLTRLGSERPIALNVKIVAATNKNLRDAIVQREFREDLYFRLSTFKLRIPPLRERQGDILPMVVRMLARNCAHTQTQPWELTPDAQRALLDYSWPGNVRELENVVQRAMVISGDHVIDLQHLMFDDSMNPLDFMDGADLALPRPAYSPSYFDKPAVQPASAMPQSLHATVKSSEYSVIQAALMESKSREEAAQKLGISPRTLRYKLARLRETPDAVGSAA